VRARTKDLSAAVSVMPVHAVAVFAMAIIPIAKIDVAILFIVGLPLCF
jgi:hypothetical protein